MPYLMFLLIKNLKFYGINLISKVPIDFDANVLEVQNALNDLPTLSPNLVNVTLNESTDETFKIFTVKFSSSLGKEIF